MTQVPISADFPFESRYHEILGSRMHYIDEGSGEPILFLHGNPTSSYLWRNIIPHLTGKARCIAPDLIGMGRSDKPDLEYRFFDHVRYIEAFIQALDLKNLTLVVHDWGSALGFHYARRHSANVRGLVFMEAILKPSSWADFPPDFKMAFKLFRSPGVGWLMISVMNLFVKKLLPRSIVRDLSEEERRQYLDAFPTLRSRRPIRRWPMEVPIDGIPADVHEAVSAYALWLLETDLSKLLFHATPGAITPPSDIDDLRQDLKNLTVVDLGPGIHFLQEDHPDRIGSEIAKWIDTI